MASRSTSGFSLLEVLIALALFSAALIGILQLQWLTQRQLQDSLYISRAAEQVYQLSVWLDAFEVTQGSALEHTLLQQWQKMQPDLFPIGAGALQQDLITLTWHNPTLEQTDCGMQRMCVRLFRE